MTGTIRRDVLVFAVLVFGALGCANSALAQSRWLDAAGAPLPFQDDASILAFLRSAQVVDEKPIGTGINQSVRLTLQKDGVRAHAVFREVDHRERSVTIARVHYQLFADSYLFECAAYELARLLEIGGVPPTVLRTLRQRKGSVQLWLEDSINEDGDNFAPPNAMEWAEQLWDMYLFDNLVYNIDRNAGNILTTPDFQLWMIDHTRAFQFKKVLLNDRVIRVRRTVWDKLNELTDESIREALRPYLTLPEMSSLLERRELLKAHVSALVDERGEGAVFY